jgi:chromosome segregation ATPase
VVLEQEVQKTASNLFAARAEGDELRSDLAQLSTKLSTAHMEIKKYQTRAKTVEKWVSSFALSIQGWRLEKDGEELQLIGSGSICADIDANESF